MGENAVTGRLFHNLFRVPSIIRALNTLHVTCRTQCVTVPRYENSSVEQAKAIQGEQEVGMQKAQRFKLYHSDAYCGGDGVFAGGNTCSRGDNTPYYIQYYGGNPRLPYCKYIDFSNEFLYNCFVSDKFCYLLRYVATV